MPYEIRVNNELSQEQVIESLREHMNSLACNFYLPRFGYRRSSPRRSFISHSTLFEIRYFFSTVVKDVKKEGDKTIITLKVRGRNDYQPVDMIKFEALKDYLERNNIKHVYKYTYVNGEEL